MTETTIDLAILKALFPDAVDFICIRDWERSIPSPELEGAVIKTWTEEMGERVEMDTKTETIQMQEVSDGLWAGISQAGNVYWFPGLR